MKNELSRISEVLTPLSCVLQYRIKINRWALSFQDSMELQHPSLRGTDAGHITVENRALCYILEQRWPIRDVKCSRSMILLPLAGCIESVTLAIEMRFFTFQWYMRFCLLSRTVDFDVSRSNGGQFSGGVNHVNTVNRSRHVWWRKSKKHVKCSV